VDHVAPVPDSVLPPLQDDVDRRAKSAASDQGRGTVQNEGEVMAMQVRPGDGSNTSAISYDGDGLDPVCVPHACYGCGESWTREDQTLGARYLIGKNWLCAACLSKLCSRCSDDLGLFKDKLGRWVCAPCGYDEANWPEEIKTAL
jgi:hypothetical protein